MSDILDDLKMMADHCDQENGDEPCPIGLLLVRAIAEIRKQRAQPVGEVPMPEPVAFRVWAGVMDKQPFGPPFLNQKTAAEYADQIKSDTEIRPLVYLTDVRTYGDAREAAGYAAGVAAERCAVVEGGDGLRVLREVFSLCEDTAAKCSEGTNDFSRGRLFEAKGIARAIGTWYQDEFCGRTHMGEPAALRGEVMIEANSKDSWICLLCKSGIKGKHGYLDDRVTPCPNGEAKP